MSTVMNTSVSRTSHTGPAQITYNNGSNTVTFVVDADGRIEDYLTEQYLASLVNFALTSYGIFQFGVPTLDRLTAIVEGWVVNILAFSVNALAAQVWDEESATKLILKPGWNYEGWLTQLPE